MADTSSEAEAFQQLRVDLNLSARELATKLGVTERTVYRWEKDVSPIPDKVSRFLFDLVRYEKKYGKGLDSIPHITKKKSNIVLAYIKAGLGLRKQDKATKLLINAYNLLVSARSDFESISDDDAKRISLIDIPKRNDIALVCAIQAIFALDGPEHIDSKVGDYFEERYKEGLISEDSFNEIIKAGIGRKKR